MNIDPITTAKSLVAEAVSRREGTEYRSTGVYVVCFCYILDGWKALLSTPVEDGRYYEVTFDKLTGSAYVDTYVKESNVAVAVGGE